MAMKNSMIVVNNYPIRVENLHGRRHLVVPVTLMVEGVHNGSHGPLYHPASELGRIVQSWNGIPVVVNHPQLDGVAVSANSPDVLEHDAIGHIYNARMDGAKLRGEAWLDEQRLQVHFPQVYDLVQQQQPIEVSIGVFTDDEPIRGNWNGEEYVAIARNHHPDHLAFLIGDGIVGACSISDGCGVRVNAALIDNKGGEVDLTENKTTTPSDEITVTLNVDTKEATEKISKLLGNFDTAAKAFTAQGYFIIQADVGYRQKIESIQGKLDRMDDDVKMHFLQDVFDDYFVYEIRGRAGGTYNGSGIYKRSYTVDANGAVEFTGEPREVHREVQYVENKKEGGTEVMANERKPCCPQKVKLLIESEHTPYQETDREFLESLDEVQINKLVDMEGVLAKEPEPVKEPEKEPEPVTNEKAIQVLRESLKTPEEFIAVMPEDMREQMNSGLKMCRDERTKLIEAIKASSRFTDELLNAKTMTELGILADMVKPKDYSGLGGGAPVVNNADNLLLPTGVGIKKEGGK